MSSLNAAYSEWLSDKSRTEGDTTSAAVDTGYYAVCYISRNDNHYNTANVRHILVKPVDEDADGTISDEEKSRGGGQRSTAFTTSGNPGKLRRTSFAALATRNLRIPAPTPTAAFTRTSIKARWSAHSTIFVLRPTVREIPASFTARVTGYHLIYYVGQGMLYSNILAEGAKRTDTPDCLAG